jgi:peptidoglycan/xylan/chitin deacetylase (PgdA/CDA1 family)
VLRRLTRLVGRPAAFIAAHLVRLSGRPGGLAFVYHRIDHTQGDPDRELVPAYGAGLFEQQVRHLRACYRVVPASELVPAALGRRRGQRYPVTITFDDDHESHVRVAVPILRRVGVPATFFLSGASLNRPLRFWWDLLQEAVDRGIRDAPGGIHAAAAEVRALAPEQRDALAEELRSQLGPDPADAGMRADEVRALAEAGCEVGFHTRRHDVLPSLDDDALSAALTDGRAALEEAAGRALRTVSYPHGQADDRVAAAARRAGFEYGFTTAAWPVRRDTAPLLIGRATPTYEAVGEFALQTLRTLVNRP